MISLNARIRAYNSCSSDAQGDEGKIEVALRLLMWTSKFGQTCQASRRLRLDGITSAIEHIGRVGSAECGGLWTACAYS